MCLKYTSRSRNKLYEIINDNDEIINNPVLGWHFLTWLPTMHLPQAAHLGPVPAGGGLSRGPAALILAHLSGCAQAAAAGCPSERLAGGR